MEYHPKHPQPFSFPEALKLDPTTITDGSFSRTHTYTHARANDGPYLLEITRLQNSLRHLKRTQDELRAYPDGPEIAEVLRENDAVMFVISRLAPLPPPDCRKCPARPRKSESTC